jgi:hypothetical protein
MKRHSETAFLKITSGHFLRADCPDFIFVVGGIVVELEIETAFRKASQHRSKRAISLSHQEPDFTESERFNILQAIRIQVGRETGDGNVAVYFHDHVPDAISCTMP